MNQNGAHLDQQNVACDPKLVYIQNLINSFCSLLSPQELPRNTTARMYMNEELWMPIRVLAKLPALDHLLLSDVMFPFVTQTLYNCASHYLEVDIAHEMVRPRWALHSSVFISNVDLYATIDQVFDLLEDIRASMTSPNNPFEYENIIISKQTANAWSISFKSPSAGLYAAMSMKSKCINGAQVIPMACVHIYPPIAAYWNTDISVSEVDATQQCHPVVQIGYAQHYSDSLLHTNMSSNVSTTDLQGPMHNEWARPDTVPYFAPALRERSYSNQSFCTQPSVGTGNETNRDPSLQTPDSTDQSEQESRSSADLDTISTMSDVGTETKNIAQNDVDSPQSDQRGAKQDSHGVAIPSEATIGLLSTKTEDLNSLTPNASHHAVADIADKIEPAGEQTKTQRIVKTPETKLHSSGFVETVTTPGNKTAKDSEGVEIAWDDSIAKSSDDAGVDWCDSADDDSTICYPKPESLHTPSFANQVHLEVPCSRVRMEEQSRKTKKSQLVKQTTQTTDGSCQNFRRGNDLDGANGARKHQKEWRPNNQEQYGDRRNGNSRNRQSPRGRRKHHRKGSGGSSSGERLPENSGNGSGLRRRNGPNKKSRNKNQRSNSEHQKRDSYLTRESWDQRQDTAGTAHTEVAGNTSMPSEHRGGSRDEDWQTISYRRLGSRRNRRSCSTTEGSSRNPRRQNGDQ